MSRDVQIMVGHRTAREMAAWMTDSGGPVELKVGPFPVSGVYIAGIEFMPEVQGPDCFRITLTMVPLLDPAATAVIERPAGWGPVT